MFTCRTKVGVFSIVPKYHSGWKLIYDKETINEYLAAQDAVDALVNGINIQGLEIKTSELGIPCDVRDWVHRK